MIITINKCGPTQKKIMRVKTLLYECPTFNEKIEDDKKQNCKFYSKDNRK